LILVVLAAEKLDLDEIPIVESWLADVESKLLNTNVDPLLGSEANEEVNEPSADGLDDEEKALGMLSKNPTISKAEIARRLNKNVRQLHKDRMPRFGQAWEISKAKEGQPGVLNADGSADGIYHDKEPDT
jgi:hypothetical protein